MLERQLVWRAFSSLSKNGEEDSGKDRNDGDDDEKLNERESTDGRLTHFLIPSWL
jgi:hypothetical protein